MTQFLSFEAPPIDKREILRYASAKEDDFILSLLDKCISEAETELSFKVGFCELKFTIQDKKCDFYDFSIESKSLSENLKEAKRVFLSIASVGHGIDRLINKYSHSSPAKALLFSAIGSERVEALLDALCSHLEKETSKIALPRFSAGYGDLPLSLQEDIFKVLHPEKQMAVYLSDAFIMSPSKSVTAFVGLK